MFVSLRNLIIFHVFFESNLFTDLLELTATKPIVNTLFHNLDELNFGLLLLSIIKTPLCTSLNIF